jgi:2-polyprenyl-3-methyl-5-hydroxy-6-metoxy-1,4-benzoquinol methylase
MNSLDTLDAKRLHASRQRMYADTNAYRQSFIDPTTGHVRADLTEERPCPVCDGTDHFELFGKNGGRYVRCQACDMVFLNPVLKDAELAGYYQGNTASQAMAHVSEADFYRRIYGAGLDLMASHCTSGALLDIGCSSGLLLDMAMGRGFDTYGVELNKAELEIAKAKGHRVWGTELHAVPGSERFDAICLWDVFEHIKDGIGYLQQLAKRTRTPDSVVFMQIPSAASLAARVMREKCNVFDGIEHVNLYAPATITRTAERAGFEILAMESVIDELKPTMNYLRYDDPYKGTFSTPAELAFLNADLIHENKLGYKLQVVLRCCD